MSKTTLSVFTNSQVLIKARMIKGWRDWTRYNLLSPEAIPKPRVQVEAESAGNEPGRTAAATQQKQKKKEKRRMMMIEVREEKEGKKWKVKYLND